MSTMEGTLRINDPLSADWVTGILLLVFVLLAYTNVASPKKWRLLWGSMFTLRLGKQVLREDVDPQDRTLIGLIVAAMVLLALFAYQVAVVSGVPSSGLLLFGRSLLFVVIALIAQVLLLNLVGVLFRSDGGLMEYLYTMLLITIVLGVVLLPVVMLVAYRPGLRFALLPLGGAVVALSVLYRWFRAVLIGVGEGVPLRHVFLYLCTAEIVPVAIAIHSATH
ncbi:MAG: DUF4271 domain-containing protein [Flavobacteriales bacterium]|nr:DUF4271 domain-containing protein [Flavobacteriales bacterium]